MLNIKFDGDWNVLCELINKLGKDVSDKLVVSFTGDVHPNSLEDRAYIAANVEFPNKIPMIKAVREVTNWGLKEGKDFVESRFSFPIKEN